MLFLISVVRGQESRLCLQAWFIFPLFSSQAQRSIEVVNKCTLKRSQLTLFSWTCSGAIYTVPSQPSLFVITVEEVWQRQKRTRPRTIWEMGECECCYASPSLPLLRVFLLVALNVPMSHFPVCRKHSLMEEWSPSRGKHGSCIDLCLSYITPPHRANDWCFQKPSGAFLCWMLPLLFQNRKTIMHQLCGENIFLDFFFFSPNNEWEEITQSEY